MKSLYKNWFIHNCVAHPLMYWLGFISKPLADLLHDSTLPEQENIKER